MVSRVGLLLRIFTGQLLPAASSWIQRLMQPNTRTQGTTAPQREDNDIDESNFQTLPESTFIEVLSAMRTLPDFSQRLSIVNEYGQTLLHLAVHLRYRRLVQELVTHGIELEVQDMYGFTALHCAYLCEDDSVVTILKQGNASAGLLDTLGRLPTDLSANPVITIPDAEMAEATDLSLTSHTRALSARSCGIVLDNLEILLSHNNRQETWEIDRENWKINAESDWFKNQELEPLYPFNGKSILIQWLKEVDEGIGWVCCVPLDSEQSWCDHGPFNRFDRAVAHVRKHLGLRPFRCRGECGWFEWYVPRFLSQSVVHQLNPNVVMRALIPAKNFRLTERSGTLGLVISGK